MSASIKGCGSPGLYRGLSFLLAPGDTRRYATGDVEGVLTPITVEAACGINQMRGDVVQRKLQPRISWEMSRPSDSPTADGVDT